MIETIIALVVIGSALGGVLLAFQTAVRGSSDAVIAQQLVAIAQSMTEEAALQPYVAQADTTSSTGCGRQGFNDVDDFNGYASAGNVCTPDGLAISGLVGYSVSIAVSAVTVSGVTMKRIDVTASRGGDSFVLRTHKADLS